MAIYKMFAKDKDGKVVNLKCEAASEEDAIANSREQGYKEITINTNQESTVKKMDIPALVGSISLILSFFMPWFNDGYTSRSGFQYCAKIIMDFVNAFIGGPGHGQFGLGIYELILLLVVLSSGVSLIGAAMTAYVAYMRARIRTLSIYTGLAAFLILLFSYFMKRINSSMSLEIGFMFILVGIVSLTISILKSPNK